MVKKLILILLITILFSLGLKLALSAQGSSNKEMDYTDFSERFTHIETKLDMLSKNTETANKELARKLDQVLSNQEKILKELVIVKIRASKK